MNPAIHPESLVNRQPQAAHKVTQALQLSTWQPNISNSGEIVSKNKEVNLTYDINLGSYFQRNFKVIEHMEHKYSVIEHKYSVNFNLIKYHLNI